MSTDAHRTPPPDDAPEPDDDAWSRRTRLTLMVLGMLLAWASVAALLGAFG